MNSGVEMGKMLQLVGDLYHLIFIDLRAASN